MPKTLIRIALLALCLVLFQETWSLAGTTGGISGYVLLQDNSPVSGIGVTASSPSETVTTATDPSGHFTFVSLTPDTYSITASKDGYATVTQAGITVIADNNQTVTLHTQRVKTIAVIPVRAANELVRPGTTADVYSVNAAQSAKLTVLGGGGGADNAYSAIASLPGAYVPPGQEGWYQTIHLRGGDYDQVGYEYDGIPVNRSFDNYPSSTASSVGQNEVQVYTGSAPQNAEGQGLAGFINQVLKNGTYPGFSTLDVAVGSPSLYNRLNFEIGGSTPSRNFTYYVATGGYQAAPRFVDNSNGASLSAVWGPMFDVWSGGNDLGTGNGICPYATADSCAANYGAAPNTFFDSGMLNGLLLGNASTALVGPAGYVLGPFNVGAGHVWADRENVVNLHFGLPHSHDSGKDDIQFMYSNSLLRNPYYISNGAWGQKPFYTNTLGLPLIGGLHNCSATGADTIACGSDNPAYFGLGGPGTYESGFQESTFPAGTTFTTACAAPCGVVRYAFPSSGVQCADLTRFCASNGNVMPLVPLQKEDSQENGQGIFKLQYQHNIGSNAFFRLYGYSYYSWWFLYGPDSNQNYFIGLPTDYELVAHTRGASAEFSDQINANHLITAQVSGITSVTRRTNNTQMINNSSGSRRRAWVLVEAADPYNGLCYRTSGAFGSCQPASVPTNQGLVASRQASFLTFYDVGTGGVPAPPSVCGATFSSPCAWLQAETGPYATFNDVKPTFYAGSLGDQWKPTDKLLINLGMRYDNFGFKGGQTDFGNISQFWLNAWNKGQCISAIPGSSPVDKMEDLRSYHVPLAAGPITPNTPCSSISDPTNPGHTYLDATLALNSFQTFNYNEWEPRFGMTYTAGPDDVIRASYGKYVQAPNTAFTFYNTLQRNSPSFFGNTFLSYGRAGPGYTNGFESPEESWNADVSWEHRFANSDASFKLSPYYRRTDHQVQTFFLDQKTAFVSGLPVGTQTAEGVEFQLQKGDFNRNGLSGLFTYTYLWTYISYGPLPNVPGSSGNNALVKINNAIKTYNGYTSFCAANPGDSRCGLPTNLMTATPCYGVFGTPAPGCPAGSIANPYWNAPVQKLFDPNGKYLPFGIFPAIFNSQVQSYAIPHIATLVLNWKHDKFAVTPALQYYGEGFYVAPLQTLGVDPANNNIPGANAFAKTGFGGGCNKALGSPIAGDPRYPYGAPAGSPFDATSCNTDILIPDPYTGVFDNLGAFRSPQQLLGHLQISYEATPRVTYVTSFNNLLNTCWGGTNAPWTLSDHRVCAYGFTGFANFLSYTGNFYNPDSTFQTQFKYPYSPIWGSPNDNGAAYYLPLNVTFEVKVKL